MRKKALPPARLDSHQTVRSFEKNRYLLIWIIGVVGVIALIMFYSLPFFAGKAFYSGTEKTAGIMDLQPQAENVPFEIKVKTNIGAAQTVGVKFTLDLPTGLDCTKVSSIKSSLSWIVDDGFVENKAECKDNKVYFEQLILDASKAKTKEFEVVTIGLGALKQGDYELKFSEFLIYDLVSQKYVVEKGEAAIVKVIIPPTVKDCGTDKACFLASLSKCEQATFRSVREFPNLFNMFGYIQFFLPKEGLAKKADYEKTNKLVPDMFKTNLKYTLLGMKDNKCILERVSESTNFYYYQNTETELLKEGIKSESLDYAKTLFDEEISSFSPVIEQCNITSENTQYYQKELGGGEISSDGCFEVSRSSGGTCTDSDLTTLTTLTGSLEVQSTIELNGKKYADSCNGNTVREWLCTNDCKWVQSAEGNEGYLCFASDPNIFVSYVDMPCSPGSVCESGKCVKKIVVQDVLPTPPVSPSGGGGGGGGSCRPDWQCGSWSYCNSTLQQSRVCYDLKCSKNKPKVEVKKCSVCDVSWVCGSWSDKVGQCGTRKCVDEHSCNVLTGKPVETKSCPIQEQKAYVPEEENYYPKSYAEASQPTQSSLTFWDKYQRWIIGGAASALVLIVMVVLLIYLISKKKVQYNCDELREWIRKEMGSGSSEKEIKETLLSQTEWTKQEIDKELKELKE
jgi:uncharacterized membrane protein